MSDDIMRVTLLTGNREKYFESEAPINNSNKVRELLLLLKSKGVNLKEPPKKKDFDWF